MSELDDDTDRFLNQPIGTSFFLNLEEILQSAELNTRYDRQWWTLSERFLSYVQDKFTAKCSCGSCDDLYQSHVDGNPYWYLEEFGCQFTAELLRFFHMPASKVIFNENMQQVQPLALRDRLTNHRLNLKYALLTVKDDARSKYDKRNLQDHKAAEQRRHVAHLFKDFGITAGQIKELGGRVQIQLQDHVFTYFFGDQAQNTKARYLKRHRIGRVNQAVE